MAMRRRRSRKSLAPTDRRIGLVAGTSIAALILLGVIVPIGAMQFENRDPFCASCHTEGETTFFQRAASGTPNDLASFHAQRASTRCIECHSGPGLAGRYVTLTYGASDLVSYYSGHYPQPAVQERPIGDEACLNCHLNVQASNDAKDHFHALLARWQVLDPANAAHCVDCHLSHDATGDPNSAFLNQGMISPACQKCHQFSAEG